MICDSEFKAVCNYLHHLAINWWNNDDKKNNAICDACSYNLINRNEGYLIGSSLWCDKCFNEKAASMIKQDPNSAGYGTLENAMKLTSKLNKDQGRLSKETNPKNYSFTDSRDGKTYKTVTIGDQIWLAENLNFETDDKIVKKKVKKVESEIQKKKILGIIPLNVKVEKEILVEVDDRLKTSLFYDHNPKNGIKYGRLYTWTGAKNACPTGWHLPSRDEWETLRKYFGGDKKSFYEALIKGGSSGFNSLMGGWLNHNGFEGEGGITFYWSSSTNGADGAFAFACNQYMMEMCFNHSIGMCLSARLIKDK
jgi:uncharacterized protein (TIGR02145 family)